MKDALCQDIYSRTTTIERLEAVRCNRKSWAWRWKFQHQRNDISSKLQENVSKTSRHHQRRSKKFNFYKTFFKFFVNGNRDEAETWGQKLANGSWNVNVSCLSNLLSVFIKQKVLAGTIPKLSNSFLATQTLRLVIKLPAENSFHLNYFMVTRFMEWTVNRGRGIILNVTFD